MVGTGDGNALLQVEAEVSSGEVLPDEINLSARVPEVLKLSHTCGAPGSREQAYLVGQRIYVPFELEMGNGQPVVGYGYYPMAATGGLTLSAADSGQQYAAFDTTDAGSAKLSSEIDGTTLDLALVQASALDGVAEPIALVLEDIDVGDENAFYVLPEAGGLTVCQADVAFEVESTSPSVCSVRKLDERPGIAIDPAQVHEYGWFAVTGLAEGTCTYTVTYPGSGAVGSFSYPIEP
ncbi:MAG: hypothetical protein R3F59_07200 [Myxococcota bacterium]